MRDAPPPADRGLLRVPVARLVVGRAARHRSRVHLHVDRPAGRSRSLPAPRRLQHPVVELDGTQGEPVRLLSRVVDVERDDLVRRPARRGRLRPRRRPGRPAGLPTRRGGTPMTNHRHAACRSSRPTPTSPSRSSCTPSAWTAASVTARPASTTPTAGGCSRPRAWRSASS